MAAGNGTRIGAPGGSKALIRVGGSFLIDHALGQLERAGVSDVAIVARGDDTVLRRYLWEEQNDHRFSSIAILPGDPAAGTGGAVRSILDHFGNSPQLISTVDVVAPLDTAARLVRHGASHPSVLSVVVAAPLIEDENPLWVAVEDDGVVSRFGKGGPRAKHVFGNIRWFSSAAAEAVRQLGALQSPERDSHIMQGLIDAFPNSVRAVEVHPVFDVDTAADILKAEEWLAGGRAV